MRLSSRIYTIRYECFSAGLYLMKDGEIRRRLIINDKAVQEHLKKPSRSDWPCDDYELFDIATVKIHTLEKFKLIYKQLPAELKLKVLPGSKLLPSHINDEAPRAGILVSHGNYGIDKEYAIDLIDQRTGELVRVQGPCLEKELLTSGAARNELIKIQRTKQQVVLLTETQSNPDGTINTLNIEEPINHYQITKLEKQNVQQTGTNRPRGAETNSSLLSRGESFHGSEYSDIQLMEDERY